MGGTYDNSYYDVDAYANEITGVSRGGVITGELYRATIDNDLIEDLTDSVVSGSVDWHGDRRDGTQMACEFRLKTVGTLTPYADYLAPFLTIQYDTGTTLREQVGLFLVSPPAERHTQITAEQTVQGRDLTWVMAQRKLTDTENVATGANFGTAIRAQIEAAGITRHDIRTTAKTLGYARTFRIGRSRFSTAHHLCHAIGYYRPFMDRQGRIVSLPYRRMSVIEPAATYSPTNQNIIDVIESEAPPDDRFANVIILKADRPDQPKLTSIKRIDNPAIAIATTNIGEWVFGPETVNDIEDQEALDALALEMLEDRSAYEQIVHLRTPPDPRQEINRTVDLILGGDKAHLDGRYRLRGWRMGFTHEEAAVDLELRRVARYLDGELIPNIAFPESA